MNTQAWDSLWMNGHIATGEAGADWLRHGALAVKDGKVAWLGAMNTLPGEPAALAKTVHDLHGHWLTPGLIDCHTHLIYAGNRADEFAKRLAGVSYEDIARAGGGIQATVAATRAASEEALFTQSVERARCLMNSGVTVVEVKSGYGLDWPTELKMLRVAKRIEASLPLTVKKTFLGAHTIPLEYRGRTSAYVDLLCQEMIPLVAAERLADAVDVFCEKIAFTLAETEQVFQAATAHGLAIKCHAEQLSDSGAAQLAARYHALSVDHLEYASQDSVRALAMSGTVAVLLPGAYYFLRETKMPPIDLLRHHQVPMAIATDCNPGTSPIMSLPLIMNMACTLFKLTPQEALAGVTCHAATALGMAATHGTLSVGKQADFAVWDIDDPVSLSYYMGNQALRQLVRGGKKSV